MILSDRDIRQYIKEGKIKIEPEPDWERSLGSCSIDLRLGEVQRAKSKEQKAKTQIKNKKYILKPGEFILATTLEHIKLSDDLCGMLHGRSSIGRRGIMVHSTAAMIDAGFRGKIVLELFNAGAEPVELKIGERICAISFEKLTSAAEVPYYKKKRAKYLDQNESIL